MEQQSKARRETNEPFVEHANRHGHDEFADDQIKWAKVEYGTMQDIQALHMARNRNIEIWRLFVRESLGATERFADEEVRLQLLVTSAMQVMLHARRRRLFVDSRSLLPQPEEQIVDNLQQG